MINSLANQLNPPPQNNQAVPPAPNSNKLQALKKISASLPVANQSLQNQKDATSAIQLKQAIAQSPSGGPKTAAAAGAATQASMGTSRVAAVDQTINQAKAVGSLALQEQGMLNQGQINNEQRKVSKVQRQLANQLSKISEDAKNTILDQQLIFDKDQRGQAFLNQRQLADWARINAENDYEFKQYEQMARQASERNLALLETSYKKITQHLQQSHDISERALDKDQQLKLGEMKRAMEQKIRDEQNRAARRAGIFQAVGTIAGAVGGAMVGGPAGAAAGAAAGGALGTAAAAS